MTPRGPVAVLLAIEGLPGDAGLVALLDAPGGRTTVVRRCVGLAELLGAAVARTAAVAVLLGSDRDLDVTSVAELAALGVHAVVLVGDADPAERERCVALGASAVVGLDGGGDELVRLVVEVAGGPAPRAAGRVIADARADRGAEHPPRPDAAPRPVDVPPAPGVVLAVWGPVGAPGRTTVAIGLAAEVAASGRTVLLVDADTYGASVAQLLGLLDEASGLGAACRHASVGRLDRDALRRCARRVPGVPNLHVLTGLPRPDRWPELSGPAIEQVLARARDAAEVVVVDCGFSLEEDEELMFDSLAPRRNAATFVALESADHVVVVGGAGPVAVQRLVHGIASLRECVPGARQHVVVNRIGRGGRRAVAEVLSRHAGAVDLLFLPEDSAAVQSAALGRTLVEVAPRSPLRAALAQTGVAVLGTSAGSSSIASVSSRRPAG